MATRTMRDNNGTPLGMWSYATAITPNLSNRENTTTVTDPLGHRTVNFFSTAMDPSFTGWSKFDYSLPFTRAQTLNVAPGVDLNLSRQVFNAAGTLLRSEFVLYERDPNSMTAAPSDAPNTNRRMVRSRTVFHDDGGNFAGLVNSEFDGLGHYRRQDTDGSLPGSNVRTHFGNYNPARGTYTINQGANTGSGFNVFPPGSPWVTETMTFLSDFEGGATAQTELCYAPNSTAVVRQRVHRLDGAAQSAADLVSIHDLDVVGNVVREKSYGGDSQAALPTGGVDPCTMALPASPKYEIDHTYAFGSRATSRYLGTSHFVLNQAIDFNTGLVAASIDSADLTTSYEYDLLGRMTWSKPSSGHGGWTQFIYTPASQVVNANVTVRRRDNGSKTAPVLSVNQLFFDSFGRVAHEFRTLPDGSSAKRETLYDGAGNKASISEWVTGAATSKTQFLNYDPFGRPGRISPPDGAAHEVTMTYQGVRRVDRMVKIATSGGAETAATTSEVYDRHGRLFSVTEPSGSSGANVTTSYGYDVGNRLNLVSTTAFVPGTGNVTQSRAFNYDRAGLLTSESHPELGSFGNGTTSYSGYDARGHLLRKIDGSNDLTFVYDAAERLTRVQETGGSQRTLKSFNYTDTSNATFTDPVTGSSCTDFRKGKLTRQSRFNYVVVLGTPFKVEMREAMTYCGRDGRLSRRTLENWVNDPVVPNESFVLPNITYDPLGNVKSLGYPQCTHAGCTAPAPRTVTYSYTEGLLAAVGNPGNSGLYSTGITYHPNLMVNKVIHGNGFTDIYALDPSSMRRPASIRVTSPSGTVGWDTGTYAYDGAGNVRAMGTHTFTYDKVSRLTSANLFLEPASSTTLRTQTYPFDAFGNLLAIGGSSARNTPTSAATNRLTSGSYEASGNLINWNGNLYQYDPFHLMWNNRTLSDEWIYLYTADDERAWSYKTDGTTLWTLRGPDAKVLREYSTNSNGWSVASDYVYRDGSLLAAETPQGLRHFHLDHLGTPRLVTASGAGGGGDFFTLTPCRVLDTRDQSVPLSPGETRILPMVGSCGIPSGATAVSVNITVVGASVPGELTAFPANELRPTASAISYPATFAQANNAILKLGNGALAFFCNQLSGTAHLIVDVNGYFMEEGAESIIAYHVYYPFGEEATAFNQDGVRAKFTGHERDLGNPGGPGDDLDYMHARHCSPITGRFLSIDEAGGTSTAPQSWNRYSYARANPLKYLDEDGREVRLANQVSRTLAAMRLMVPPAVRSAITTIRDGKGRMVVAIKGGTTSTDINFRNLQKAVNSPGIVQINQTAPDASIAFKKDGHDGQTTLSDIPLKGVTLPTRGTVGNGAITSTTKGVIQIHIDSSLSAAGQAPVIAGELAGHAVPGLLGQGGAVTNDNEHDAREDPAIEAARRNRGQTIPPP